MTILGLWRRPEARVLARLARGCGGPEAAGVSTLAQRERTGADVQA